LTWLKATILKDFIDIVKNQFQIWDDNNFNKSTCTYILNGSTITFIGLDQEAGKQKAHGMKSDIAYFNECLEVGKDSVAQVLFRNTGHVLFDFNPACGVNHFIFTDILRRRQSVLIHSTYKDNPFLEQAVIDEIERREPTPENIERGSADETLWKIYGLGIRALVRGRVYPNVSIIKELPHNIQLMCFGLDFGFTNDPTACVFVGISGGNAYFDEKFYETGLVDLMNPEQPSIRSIEGCFKESNITKRHKIAADDAEPKAIQNLRNNGWNINKANKGTILDGISSMKRFNIHVTERSYNMIKEFENYKWAEDADGEPTNKAVAAFDHTMDAARYGLISIEPGRINFTRKGSFISSKPINTSCDKYNITDPGMREASIFEKRWLQENVYGGKL